MSSNEVRFDMIEGTVVPDQPERRAADAALDEPPAAPELPLEQLSRALRRIRRRQARLRAD